MHGLGEMMSKYKVISGTRNNVFAQVKMPGAPQTDDVPKTPEEKDREINSTLNEEDLERQRKERIRITRLINKDLDRQNWSSPKFAVNSHLSGPTS